MPQSATCTSQASMQPAGHTLLCTTMSFAAGVDLWRLWSFDATLLCRRLGLMLCFVQVFKRLWWISDYLVLCAHMQRRPISTTSRQLLCELGHTCSLAKCACPTWWSCAVATDVCSRLLVYRGSCGDGSKCTPAWLSSMLVVSAM